MTARILTRTKTSVTKWHEQADGGVVIEKVFDVEPILDAAKERHNIGAHTTGMGDKHVASIPVEILDMWAKQRGKTFADVMQDQSLMTAFLEDPAHSAWRIWKGQL